MRTKIYKRNEFTLENLQTPEDVDTLCKFIAEVDKELDLENIKIKGVFYKPCFCKKLGDIKYLFVSPYKIKKSIKEGESSKRHNLVGECPACGKLIFDVYEMREEEVLCPQCKSKLQLSIDQEKEYFNEQEFFVTYYSLLLEKLYIPKEEI